MINFDNLEKEVNKVIPEAKEFLEDAGIQVVEFFLDPSYVVQLRFHDDNEDWLSMKDITDLETKFNLMLTEIHGDGLVCFVHKTYVEMLWKEGHQIA